MRLLYTRTRSIGSVLIRAMPPWGPWSHCALVLSDDEVIEALALRGGVVRETLPQVLARSSAWQMVDLECPDDLLGEQWARGTLGAGYDWPGVLGIPARRRPWQREGLWYCSEHCAEALERAGRRIVPPGAHGLTPTHLHHLTYAAGHRVLAGE